MIEVNNMTIFCIFMILLIGILAVYLGRQYLHKKADFGPLVTKALSGMLGISLLSVLVLWFFAPESVRETAGQPQLFPAIIYTVQMYSLDTNVEFLMGIAETAGTIGKVLMGILMVINPVLLLGTISRMILTEILHYGTDSVSYIPVSTDTIAVTAQGMRQWNAGVVAGVGVLFKINVGNYYLLLKADVSGHAAVINSFTSEEIHGESQHVVGAGYIDPYLLGMRFNTDVTAKVTLMFPLKKQLQGACIRWGEYD
jgi:hypothetical protein